jgi:hypothetical protein
MASLSYLVWCLVALGEFAEGIARGEEGVRLAEEVAQPEVLIFAYRGVGYLTLVKGDLQEGHLCARTLPGGRQGPSRVFPLDGRVLGISIGQAFLERFMVIYAVYALR